ncbi:TonB-dependent receptor [Pseudomaricurvus alkylphenolicus]|jgi:iron complex outermembrane receptor protein|uniref:TonB-dependent receptor n=1 Tax=Pseudomaricurvus alkylphenolicus TaxID=1306991 RepID=UPI001420AB69|nr:TonB-dependent receptor [Pseudomaricurvus alkylphenolicus]NIB38938.1 TonB-dependent receptor [Pseudomaricurvus alkylphenolicus]
MKKITTSSVLLSCATSLLSAATVAESDAHAFQLEEIIVTAQKREENLQDVPIAITAMTQEQLEIKGINDTNSLADSVPNLFIRNVVSTDLSLAIRGVTNNQASNVGIDNTVGTYMDGVFFTAGVGALFELGDIERIEVLRGPQGTLYGRNTTGGAINLISARPSGEFSGKLKAGLGNKHLQTYGATLNTPYLGEANQGLGQIAARFSFYSRERDGLTKNVQQNLSPTELPIADFSEFGVQDRLGGHLAVDWEIRNNLLVTYDYIKSTMDERPAFFQLIDLVPAANEPNFANYATEEFESRGSANHPVFYDGDVDAHSLTVTWDISDNLTVKTITGYRETQADEMLDLDGSATDIYANHQLTDANQFSQELQLLGNYENFKYVVGAYYFSENSEMKRMQRVAIPSFGLYINRRLGGKADNRNHAVFGQLDWDVTDKLTLTLGARHTKETKQMDRYIEGGFTPVRERFGTPFGLVRDDISFSDPDFSLQFPDADYSNSSYTVSARYTIDDDLNFYARYAEGFRSGGYDGSTADPVAAGITFDPEYIDSYEIGVKSNLWGRRLQVNAAAFYNDYTDIQLGVFDGTLSLTENGGRVDLWGMEIEAIAMLTERLRMGLTYGYLGYNIKEYDQGVNGDVSDEAKMTNAPEDSYNISFDYRFPEFEFGQLDFFLNYNYSSGAHVLSVTRQGTAPNSKSDSRRVVDARLQLSGIEMAGGDLVVSLWGKNLANTEYFDMVIDFSSYRSGRLGEPRTFGLEASYTF